MQVHLFIPTFSYSQVYYQKYKAYTLSSTTRKFTNLPEWKIVLKFYTGEMPKRWLIMIFIICINKTEYTGLICFFLVFFFVISVNFMLIEAFRNNRNPLSENLYTVCNYVLCFLFLLATNQYKFDRHFFQSFHHLRQV